jgi:hypothetical protein
MLFRFEPSMIKFQKIKISNLSYSFGGTLTILDEERSTPERDVFKRYPIPLALARVFKEKYKISRFLVPIEGCIMTYQNNVIAIEKAQFNERYYMDSNDEIHEWQPIMESVFKHIKLLTYSGNWYFDGSYIYTFRNYNNVYDAIINGEPLNEKGNFRAVKVDAIRVTYVGYTNEVNIENRQCLAYLTSTGEYSISPPIWKQMSGLGNSNLKKVKESEMIGLTSQFDKVDAVMGVNLNFALQAGNILTKQFGYKSIEPLQLPKLMIQLKTVNLPRISSEIKQTFDIGMTFTQTIAWLLGLQKNLTEYDQMLALRKLFKYISIKGIFAKKSLTDIRINENVSVPLLTRQQAEQNAIKFLNPDIKQQNILNINNPILTEIK